MNIIELGLFERRLQSVCDEMGVTLQRTAISPNIRDRLDYSCAVFDAHGRMLAQAAHIPVHLGSMAFAMADIVGSHEWSQGDMLVLNDPFLGGTHLPDVTMIAPVFIDDRLTAFAVNRAHHASMGARQPGGMPLATHIDEEGLLIPPSFLVRRDVLDHDLMTTLANTGHPSPFPDDNWSGHPGAADFLAQMAANRIGRTNLEKRITALGRNNFIALKHMLNDHAARFTRSRLRDIGDGVYEFTDFLDDDGIDTEAVMIKVKLTVTDGLLTVDFDGTSAQVRGNLNCPLPVTAAAVFYVVRSLMPPEAPTSAGVLENVTIKAPGGCLVNAEYPAAVAAGNVETSMRIVDVLLGALAPVLPDRIPAAAQGTMNNIAMGSRKASGASRDWDYYETIAGGLGGHAGGSGLSGVHAHMTNTLNTPLEVLESQYPVRISRYALRRGSEGPGHHGGGAGVIREFEFLEPASVSLLTERRRLQPWGLAGGGPGKPGINRLNGRTLPGKTEITVQPGDLLTIMTPGGGGYGRVR